jgi:hypothetical protein
MENKERKIKKQGRPAKGKAKLSTSINLKLTESDFKKVSEKADRLGMKATQYVREMTLKGGIKSRFTLEELDLIRKLSGMANNLNQLARKANSIGYKAAEKVLFEPTCEIKRLLDDR